MDKQTIEAFVLKLLGLVPINPKFQRFLREDELGAEVFSRTQKFVEEYSKSNQDDGLEIYAEYETDLQEKLSLGYSLNKYRTEALPKALEEFIDENNLDKSDEEDECV